MVENTEESTQEPRTRRRRTAATKPGQDDGKSEDDSPATGVPGTEDGPPVNNWRGEHGHAHDEDSPEHIHPEGQDTDACASQHSDLAFDQGPEASRDVDPPTPEEPVGDGEDHEEEIARPIAGRSSTSEDPQAAFGDVLIDVKTKDGLDLLKLFESRARTLSAYRAFDVADREIKKIMTELGHYNGNPINVRVGGYLFSLVATSDDKDIEAYTRHGSQRKSIISPD